MLQPKTANRSFRLLQIGLSIILLINGFDKFPQVLADWSQYFPFSLLQTLHIPLWIVLYGSGIVEMLAGVLILFRPRIGGLLAALIFLMIDCTLILLPGYYNIAVIDFGLLFASLSLAEASK